MVYSGVVPIINFITPFRMQISAPSTGQKSCFDVRKSIRETFRKRNTPEQSIEIVVSSLAVSNIKQYSGAIKQWLDFCSKSKLDPYQATEG